MIVVLGYVMADYQLHWMANWLAQPPSRGVDRIIEASTTRTLRLVKQANGVVQIKLRAWNINHGPTEWKDGRGYTCNEHPNPFKNWVRRS